MFGYDLGIDLGTNSIVISVPGKGVVLNEPTYVAYDSNTKKVLYAGRRAYFLQGREPEGVSVLPALHDGAIREYDLTEQMLRAFISKIIGKSIFKPRVLACIPSVTTDVEKRTIISVLISAGARSVCLLEEPLAAAFGAGIDPMQAVGTFVIDIGAGTTDMAVVTSGSMAQTETVKIAGNDFDNEIIKYIKNTHGLLVGVVSAEEIKKSVLSAVEREQDVMTEARGRDIKTGLPLCVEISGNELYFALKPLFDSIASTAKDMFERTTPQLVADITSRGVILTGGCAEIYGMDKLISGALGGVEVNVASEPKLCVAKGAEIALEKMHILDRYGYTFKTKEDVRIR